MRYPSIEEQLLFLHMLAKVGPTNIHSPEFRIRYFANLLFVQGVFRGDVPPEAIMREIEEAHMELEMEHPQNDREFLFWAWADLTYDFEETDAWNLRYHMMIHHFKQNIEKSKP